MAKVDQDGNDPWMDIDDTHDEPNRTWPVRDACSMAAFRGVIVVCETIAERIESTIDLINDPVHTLSTIDTQNMCTGKIKDVA